MKSGDKKTYFKLVRRQAKKKDDTASIKKHNELIKDPVCMEIKAN